jgi:hypothetical protein
VSYTKRQLIEGAFTEIGMASFVFDMEPEDLQSALRKLDSMMAMWNGRGIRLSYPVPLSPTSSSLEEDSNLPDWSVAAVIANLGIQIAPSYGKVVAAETRFNARDAYNVLLSRAASPIEMQFPNTLPTGAGNKPWTTNGPFMPGPVDPLLSGPDSLLTFN